MLSNALELLGDLIAYDQWHAMISLAIVSCTKSHWVKTDLKVHGLALKGFYTPGQMDRDEWRSCTAQVQTCMGTWED